MSKIVYQLDEAGGFVGETTADESPLEPGVYLIPAGCVEKAPPAPVEGKQRVFSGGKWRQQTIAPEPEPAPPEPFSKTRFSVLDFRDRFTHAEQLAIRQAQFEDMEVGLVYDNFQAAQYIDIEDPRVAAGLDLYEAKNLLEPGRKTELLEPEVIQPEDAQP